MADEPKTAAHSSPTPIPQPVPLALPHTAAVATAPEPNVEVEFLRDYEVKDGTGTKYEKGSVWELPASSANHFISRGAAKATEDDKARAKQVNRRMVKAAPEPADDEAETREAASKAATVKAGGPPAKPDAFKAGDITKTGDKK